MSNTNRDEIKLRHFITGRFFAFCVVCLGC